MKVSLESVDPWLGNKLNSSSDLAPEPEPVAETRTRTRRLLKLIYHLLLINYNNDNYLTI